MRRMEVGDIFFSPNRLLNSCALSATDKCANFCNVDGETKYPMCCCVNFDQLVGPISKLKLYALIANLTISITVVTGFLITFAID